MPAPPQVWPDGQRCRNRPRRRSRRRSCRSTGRPAASRCGWACNRPRRRRGFVASQHLAGGAGAAVHLRVAAVADDAAVPPAGRRARRLRAVRLAADAGQVGAADRPGRAGGAAIDLAAAAVADQSAIGRARHASSWSPSASSRAAGRCAWSRRRTCRSGRRRNPASARSRRRSCRSTGRPGTCTTSACSWACRRCRARSAPQAWPAGQVLPQSTLPLQPSPTMPQ